MPSYFTEIHTQIYHSTSLRKRMVGWEVFQTTLLKLTQNEAICIRETLSINTKMLM